MENNYLSHLAEASLAEITIIKTVITIIVNTSIALAMQKAPF